MFYAGRRGRIYTKALGTEERRVDAGHHRNEGHTKYTVVRPAGGTWNLIWEKCACCLYVLQYRHVPSCRAPSGTQHLPCTLMHTYQKGGKPVQKSRRNVSEVRRFTTHILTF